MLGENDAMASKTLDKGKIRENLSQRVMKEMPRKRLRTPPNSAIKDAIGKISCSVETLVSETAHSEKATVLSPDLIREGWLSLRKLYFL